MEYYLGLDMGTNSVGWAVTDTDYRLIRAKGKDLWGIREFEEASTAVERRTHRISRRRRQREQVRLGLVKSYFDEAICEIDPNFFARLDNSKYHLDDKDEAVQTPNAIFNDLGYQDADYYKQYPTIFHLRKELIENSAPHDVRLVYLAISNMFKHRGHFLNAGLTESSSDLPKMSDAYSCFVELFNQMSAETEEYAEVQFKQISDANQLENILSSREYSRTIKVEKMAEFLEINSKNKTAMAYLKLIAGLKVDAKQLFLRLDTEEKVEICFSDSLYDEKCDEIHQKVGDDNYQIIEAIKNIYDIGVLSGILKGEPYISFARVSEYNKHKKDLAVLKRVMREYCSQLEYDEMFRSEASGTYSAYVHSVNSGNKARRSASGRSKDDLYKKIRGVLKVADEKDIDVIYIKGEMDKDNFLPKQLTSSNGVIPNQVHKAELKKILSNAKGYLSFLNDVDDTGLTIADKIEQLFSFQIPYYVGPTTEKSAESGGNGWVVRKANGPVLPWTIENVIDINKTSEEFIHRLIRECTYIHGEKVLPKESLIYQKFCVLNELNNLKVDNEKISVELKQEIYNDLFKSGKRVSKKNLIKYLVGQGIITDEAQVSGIDIMINNSLGSYGKFLSIFGEKMELDQYYNIAEEIVYWCTIYGDSKQYLRDLLKTKYKDVLDDVQIKRILGFKFKDWGKLSREFLELEGSDENGEITSLISALWNTNYNMMELIHSDRFMFKKSLEEKQNKALKTLREFKAEDLDEFYFSAPVKRMIWQTILIIREIEKVLGEAPARIFVEMTRADDEKGDKGRKDSRKKQLLELYKNVEDESKNWTEIIEQADSTGVLRSKKMYLYLTQMGRCMYTGNPIDLDDLFNDNKYDIDHIYPRSIVKDDNLSNNLVLVEKEYNARKSDIYPLDSDIINNPHVTSLWRTLREKNLITEEKYHRLTGRTAFTDEQRAGFIARQLVETSQGTKGVADILKQLLPDSTIVYAKASNVSDFRKKYDLLKCRVVNDFHHANDAYLNIVVGNVYYTKFTQNPLNYIRSEYRKDEEKYHYNLSRMFDWDVTRDGKTAWIASKKDGESGTIATVKEVMRKNTPLMTRLNFEGHGAIANETLYSANQASPECYIPFKSSDNKMKDVTKYGGFSSVSTAYFFLVEHEVKGKKVRTIETLPIYLKDKVEKDRNVLLDYCVEVLKLSNPTIRLSKINIQSLVKKDGYYMYISGKTKNQIVVKNAISLNIDAKWNKYIKKIDAYYSTKRLDDVINREDNIALYDILRDKHIDSIFSKRPNAVGEKLSSGREKFVNLNIEEQCIVLREIFNLSVIGNTSADFQLIGQGASVGTLKISKKISNAKEMKLINQSITGIYETEVDLLSV